MMKHPKSIRHSFLRYSLAVVGIAAAAACGDDDTGGGGDGGDGGGNTGGDDKGTLTVILESEDTIVNGLEPGEDTENIKDGWKVTFGKYITTIGDIDLHLSTDEDVESELPEVFVVDLTKVPATGFSLWGDVELQAGRWEFNYSTPGAKDGDGATRHESVEEADYNQMVENDWTYLIEGTLTQTDGQSCPPADLASIPDGTASNGNTTTDGDDCYDADEIKISFGATAETLFGPCEVDEVSGFAITANGTQTVAATIHGDHLFFNGFPEGDEGGVNRYAQWWADSDLNLDGTVTAEELKAISLNSLSEIDDRYNLGGSPIENPENMYQYVIAQLKTQGHYQGEGECPIDGKEHDHDHD